MSLIQQHFDELTLDLEAAKVEDQEPAYEMTVEDYFEVSDELSGAFEAVEQLGKYEDNLNTVIDKLTPVVGEFTPAALAVINEVVATSAPFFAVPQTFVTLDVEAEKEGEEAKKETGADKKTLKERAGKIKDQAMRMLAKAYNMVADFVRKFRTGTAKLQANIKGVIGKITKDVELEKAPAAFYYGTSVVTAKDLEQIAKDHAVAVKDGVEKGFELKQLGGGTLKAEAADGKVKVSTTKSEAKPGKVTLKAAEAKALLEAAATLAGAIGSIDHKGITKKIDANAKRAIENDGSMQDVSNMATVLRTLTVTYPSATAKALATIYASISKAAGVKPEKAKKDDDKSKDGDNKGGEEKSAE